MLNISSCAFSNLDAPLVETVVDGPATTGFDSKIDIDTAPAVVGLTPMRLFISSSNPALMSSWPFGTEGGDANGGCIPNSGDDEAGERSGLNVAGRLKDARPPETVDVAAALSLANSGSSGYKEDFRFWLAPDRCSSPSEPSSRSSSESTPPLVGTSKSPLGVVSRRLEVEGIRRMVLDARAGSGQ